MSILAFDLGGSSLKAGLFGPDGRLRGLAARPLGFEEDGSGRSEADPALWWQALVATAVELTGPGGVAGGDPVSAVAICGFTRSQVCLDAAGEPVGPALCFRDARATGLVAALSARPGIAAHPEAGGFNAFHPLARLAWLAAERPSDWARVARVLEPKDYLALRLTGRAVSDPVSMHWLARGCAGGDGSLAAALGIGSGVVPPLLAPGSVIGPVRAEADPALGALAGVPVLMVSNDSWTAAAGLGALTPGRAYCISGTSEVLGLMTDRPAEAPGLLTLPWGDGLWHLGGPGQNGATVLDWAVDRLAPGGGDFATRLAGLLEAPRAARPLLFAPYLHGERTPHWDPELRGAFLGLSAEHGPGDMLHAVLEGVALVDRDILERAEHAWGRPADELRLAGGGARLPAWTAIRATITGRPVAVPDCPELGLQGCLTVAHAALGRAGGLAEAADRLLPGLVRTLPDPAGRARADALLAAFRESRAGLARTARALAAAGRLA